MKKYKFRTIKTKIRCDRFVENYLQFGCAKTAYLTISPNVSNTTAIDLGCAYLKKDYVKERILEKNEIINKKMDKKIQINREKIIEELVDILEKTKTKEDYNLSLKSLDQISKIIGAYAVIKTENKNENITINYINPTDEIEEEEGEEDNEY